VSNNAVLSKCKKPVKARLRFLKRIEKRAFEGLVALAA
jgi:hypothetical protein